MKSILKKLKKRFGENIETMTVILRKYNPDRSAIKGQKRTKTFDACAIEYRVDRDKFSALKSDLEKDGKAMVFGVMHNDCGELMGGLLYDYQTMVNFWGVLVLKGCGEFVGNPDNYHCYPCVEIADWNYGNLDDISVENDAQ